MTKGLLGASLLFAVTATLGLAVLVLRGASPSPAPSPSGDAESEYASPLPGPRTPVLRRYQTTSTLVEDLRDALGGAEGRRAAELERVAHALESRAAWTLSNLAPRVASPRVRALLVHAAGRHAPDAAVLLGFLEDRAAVVRRAAVLATGFAAHGARRAVLEPGIEVPVGRALPERTAALLGKLRGGDPVESVRAAVRAVLAARPTTGRR